MHSTRGWSSLHEWPWTSVTWVAVEKKPPPKWEIAFSKPPLSIAEPCVKIFDGSRTSRKHGVDQDVSIRDVEVTMQFVRVRHHN